MTVEDKSRICVKKASVCEGYRRSPKCVAKDFVYSGEFYRANSLGDMGSRWRKQELVRQVDIRWDRTMVNQ